MELSKSELRLRIRAARIGREIHFDFGPLIETSEFRDARVIASYRSYGEEPDTQEINREILARGKKLLLPRLLPDKDLHFIPWDGESKLNIENRIEVPAGENFEGKIDLVIVPALALDRFGNRLGQGGGSYDRALSRTSAWRIAMINGEELFDSIPTEPHDLKMDAALLPDQLVRF